MNPQLDAINMFLPLALAGICDMYANPYEDNRQAVLSELNRYISLHQAYGEKRIPFLELLHMSNIANSMAFYGLLRNNDAWLPQEWNDPQTRWLKAIKWELLPGTTRFRRSDDDPYESETEMDYLDDPEVPESFYYTEDISPHGADDEPLHMIDYSRRSCFKFVYNKLIASEIRYMGRKRLIF